MLSSSKKSFENRLRCDEANNMSLVAGCYCKLGQTLMFPMVVLQYA